MYNKTKYYRTTKMIFFVSFNTDQFRFGVLQNILWQIFVFGIIVVYLVLQ